MTDVETSHKVLNYWRNSLADEARLGLGTTQLADPVSATVSVDAFLGGVVDTEVFNRLQKLLRDATKYDIGRKRPEGGETETTERGPKEVSVVFCPLHLQPRVEHTQSRRSGGIAPLWIPAIVDASGAIKPSPGFPWISRDCLDPAGPDAMTIGALEVQDTYLEAHTYEPKSWAAAVAWANALFTAVTGQDVFKFTRDDLAVVNPGVVRVIPWQDGSGMISGIMNAYNAFLSEGVPIPKLLEAATRLQKMSIEPGALLDEVGIRLGTGLHLGQMRSEFPLSESQRESMKHFASLSAGEMLAVNGPPGTGKTTLLHSVIATSVVQAAVQGGEACLTVASSTNNQAVTNVVESFGATGADAFFQRWIPGVTSHGVYFPAAKLADESRGKGFQCFSNDSPTRLMGIGTEPTYFAEAEAQWLASAKIWLEAPDAVDLKAVVGLAHQKVFLWAEKLSTLQARWSECEQARLEVERLRERISQLQAEIVQQQSRWTTVTAAQTHWQGGDTDAFGAAALLEGLRGWGADPASPLHAFTSLRSAWTVATARRVEAERSRVEHRALMAAWRSHMERMPWWQGVFGWIPFVGETVKRRNGLFCLEQGLEGWPNDVKGFELRLHDDLIRLDGSIKSLIRVIGENEQAKKTWFDETARDLMQQVGGLEATVVAATQELATFTRVVTMYAMFVAELCLDSELDPIQQEDVLDVGIRHRLFWAAIHYWEGRWLQDRPKEGERISKAESFRWLAKLIPCFVITLHRLPSEFRDRGEILPEFIDLLILDESGQVAPHTGGVAFGFAKRALVVGDTLQIAPIRAMVDGIDRANLRVHGLVGPNALHRGAAATYGTIIEVAQAASKFEKFEPLRGMFLSEHRRCSDEIIAFCNELAYKGRLNPLTGDISKKSRFPGHPGDYSHGWGFAHIPGRVVSGAGGKGKSNPLEAGAIANWIKDHQTEICRIGRKDGEPSLALKDAVAVITPYSLQKSVIQAAFATAGLPEDVTIGTVHTLQGAERPMVIFSPVVTKWERSAPFFDRGDQNPSMLNVAVSRAKQNFLVFGDMEMLESRPEGSPSRVLLKYLRSNELNQLNGVRLPIEVAQAEAGTTVDRIVGLAGHEQALEGAFRSSKVSVVVVSPWLSSNAIGQGVVALVRDAVGRGVEVAVYTDADWNMTIGGKVRKSVAIQGAAMLEGAGAKVLWVKGIHNKSLMVDRHTIIEGSFNWLSAVRDEEDPHNRFNASLRYSGQPIEQMVQNARLGMEARARG